MNEKIFVFFSFSFFFFLELPKSENCCSMGKTIQLIYSWYYYYRPIILYNDYDWDIDTSMIYDCVDVDSATITKLSI